MTRKDYFLIAEAFKSFNYLHQPTRYFIAHALADRLEKDNPRFNRKTFIDLCDVHTLGNRYEKVSDHSEAVVRSGSLAFIERGRNA